LRVERGEWRVESGEWRVESGEWRVESGDPIAIRWRMRKTKKSPDENQGFQDYKI